MDRRTANPTRLILSCATALTALTALTSMAAAQPAPRTIVDAAVEGEGAYAGKAYFFAGDYYIRYDWGSDRVDDGYPQPISAWPLSGGFNSNLDAALTGVGAYAGKGYFFKGGSYLRYDWASEALDQAATPLSAWKLTGPFASRVDAAINGQGPLAGFAYFFTGASYVKYSWAKDALVNAPRTITQGWKLPGAFATGVDAAVNGRGRFAGKGYFFKNDQYVRYLWASDAPDGGAQKIAGNWGGLAEMLEAARGAGEARTWIAAALPWLRADLSRASAGLPPLPGNGASALATHFHLSTAAERQAFLPGIIANFEAVDRVLADPHAVFRFRDLAQATADRGVSGGVPFPAYTFFNSSINFTTTFAQFGPKCQGAMALHETVHFVDGRADINNDFYEHGPQYATLTADQAAHNPSSYASFAGQLTFGSDVRFGAGRPND